MLWRMQKRGAKRALRAGCTQTTICTALHCTALHFHFHFHFHCCSVLLAGDRQSQSADQQQPLAVLRRPSKGPQRAPKKRPKSPTHKRPTASSSNQLEWFKVRPEVAACAPLGVRVRACVCVCVRVAGPWQSRAWGASQWGKQFALTVGRRLGWAALSPFQFGIQIGRPSWSRA